MFERLRARIGRAFTRTDVSPLTQTWITGGDMQGEVGLSDPYGTSGLIFRCVNLIGLAASVVPFELLDYKTDQPVFDNPVVTFFENPNEYQTWVWFMRTWIMFSITTGNGDLWVQQDSLFSGLPKSITPLSPGTVYPRRRGTGLYTLDGWDIIDPYTGQARFVPPDQVLRLQYAPTADPHIGIGPVQLARLAAATDRSAALYNANSMQNGGTPPGLLKLKGVNYIRPEDKQQAKDEWHSTVGGIKNAGRIAILSGDMDFQALGFSMKDMEYLDARKWNKEEVGTIMDVPLSYLNGQKPHGLGDAGMRVDERRLYQTNVGPLLRTAQQTLDRIVKRMTAGKLYCRFNLTTIEAMQPSVTEKVTQTVALLGTGQFTRNEVNDRLELGFKENDEWGNERPTGAAGPGMDHLMGNLLGKDGEPAPPHPQQPPQAPQLGHDIKLTEPLPELDLGKPPPNIDLSRAGQTGESRASLWWRKGGQPLTALYERALGRVQSHFADQRSRMLKALGRRTGDGGVRWLPGHARVDRTVIDRVLAAYQVGGLARAILPVNEAAWIAGAKSAETELRRQKARRGLTRQGLDAELATEIAQALAKGQITYAQSQDITSLDQLHALIDLNEPGEPIAAATSPSGAVPRIKIPLQYAPKGTEKIVLNYFDPHMQMMNSIDTQVRDAIGRSLKEGWEQGETLRELKDRIKGIMTDVSDARARTIARTETATFRNGARYEFMQAQGVQKIQWLSMHDNRVRDSHEILDGDVVELGDQFRNGLRFPCEVGGPPEEVINCRCTILPIAEGLTDSESDSLAELGLRRLPAPADGTAAA